VRPELERDAHDVAALFEQHCGGGGGITPPRSDRPRRGFSVAQLQGCRHTCVREGCKWSGTGAPAQPDWITGAASGAVLVASERATPRPNQG
jgi:hypothetical protein